MKDGAPREVAARAFAFSRLRGSRAQGQGKTRGCAALVQFRLRLCGPLRC